MALSVKRIASRRIGCAVVLLGVCLAFASASATSAHLAPLVLSLLLLLGIPPSAIFALHEVLGCGEVHPQRPELRERDVKHSRKGGEAVGEAVVQPCAIEELVVNVAIVSRE